MEKTFLGQSESAASACSERLNELKAMLGDEIRCAIDGESDVFTSDKPGIAPLIEAVDSGKYFGCVAADRIVGKAAALLYAYLGAEEVFGQVMSEEGERTLCRFNIPHSYAALTPFIRNRKGDGICPMEQTVSNIDDPAEALSALKAKLLSLRG